MSAHKINTTTSDGARATIGRMCVESSLKAFSIMQRGTEAEQNACDVARLKEFEHWITSIVLAHNCFKLTFHVRFSLPSAQQFAAKALDREVSKIDLNLAKDSVGEFCNMAVGHLKRYLGEAHNALGDSAMTTPISKINDAKMAVMDHSSDQTWMLSANGINLCCMIHLDIRDPATLSMLEGVTLEHLSVSDGGDVIFF